MTKQKLLDWAKEILASEPATVRDGHGIATRAERVAWLMAATSFVEACIPEGHPIRRELGSGYLTPVHLVEIERFERTKGVFLAAKTLVEMDRLDTFADSVRVQTESEVLDSAYELHAAGHPVAATVLAGGALEVHLRRLFEKTPNLAPIKGDPSIGKYDGAIAAGRNGGLPVPYEQVDSKNIAAWAGFRNVAAHTPDKVTATDAQIRLMLDGVREFIARVR